MYNLNLLTSPSHHALQLNGDRDTVLISKRAQFGGSPNKNKPTSNCSTHFFGGQCPSTTNTAAKATSTSPKAMTTSGRAPTTTAKTVPTTVSRPSSVTNNTTSTTPTTVQPLSSPSATAANGDNPEGPSILTSNAFSSSPSSSAIPHPTNDSDRGNPNPHNSSSSTDENGSITDATSTSIISPLPISSGLDGGDTINNAKANSTGAASKGANVRAIVGGIVGAITFILLLLFAIWAIRRRRKNRMAPSAEFIRSHRTPFRSGTESRFRHLDDTTYDADAQSISNFPFETAPPHGTQESYRPYFHQTREKSDII